MPWDVFVTMVQEAAGVKADPTWLRMVAEWLQNGGQAVVAFEGDAAKNREFFAGHPGDSDSGAEPCPQWQDKKESAATQS